MIINVGSKNEVKINAIKEAIAMYPRIFANCEVKGVDVNVELYGHPKSLKQTIEGAKIRAVKAFNKCDYSVGIEGGLMEIPIDDDTYAEVSVCIIYDGQNFYTGLGPTFEWPKNVQQLILDGKADASQAFKQLKYTTEEKLGANAGGICGFLSNGHLTREEQIKYSFISAMFKIERADIYKK